jgi:hypothetical protein
MLVGQLLNKSRTKRTTRPVPFFDPQVPKAASKSRNDEERRRMRRKKERRARRERRRRKERKRELALKIFPPNSESADLNAYVRAPASCRPPSAHWAPPALTVSASLLFPTAG